LPSPPTARRWQRCAEPGPQKTTATSRTKGFEARFLDWYERESARRVSWLAEISGEPAGMMNLALFERMPHPGGDAGTWGYLSNAFVLQPHRNQGIGALLLNALVAHADDHGYLRIVLRPSQRAIPFYNRADFTPEGGFLVRRPFALT
jgi:GNAT superfamily N-acetyltransferase